MGTMGTPYTNAVPAIVPDEEDLPGWVPKNYIEKGKMSTYVVNNDYLKSSFAYIVTVFV